MGQKLSDKDETRNIRHLNDFRRYWRQSKAYPAENFGNDHVHMRVKVVYEWENGKMQRHFESEFRAWIGCGPDDGRIDIDDTLKVKIEDFHLCFRPAFQTYLFDSKSKELIISDSSLKMGGNYRVRIRPTIDEP